jgi:hypothetical protein
MVEVKIAVKGTARELVFETDQSSDEIADTVRTAIEDAVGMLDLTDAKGRRILVPADKISFVEFGQPTRGRVGFGA